ncbi:MAG: SDR family oxidoreductase [Bacteroidia bacterium]|nr:SDR family oxidoreductase [Bacteroidia bacterium]
MHKSQTIFITGGTGKIGSRLVRHFLGQGDTVVISSRGIESARALSPELFGKSLFAVEVDLEADGAEKVISAQLQSQGLYPDVLIHNARNVANLAVGEDGISRKSAFAAEYMMAVAIPYLITMELVNANGSKLNNVIHIASMYGVVPPNPGLYDDPARQAPIQYGTAKAGMIHLTKELAVRLAPQGIRVNAISYGGVEGRVSADFLARYSSLLPMGRMLREDEVAGPAGFLASDASSGMTGHNLIFDGGWSVW